MTQQTIAVTVSILDREYQIACQPHEQANLQQAAEFLNGKMREIRSRGNIIGADRIAVMAALNIANELLQLKTLETDFALIDKQIETLNLTVNETLANAHKQSLL